MFTIRSVPQRGTTVAALTALLMVLPLGLSGCSSDDSSSTPASAAESSSRDEQASPTPSSSPQSGTSADSVQGFPVDDAFGDAEWSVDIDGPSSIEVRPDRIIIDTAGGSSDSGPIANPNSTDRTITALDAKGKEAWSQDFTGVRSIDVLESTVAVEQWVTSEGSGLDKDQDVQTLTLFSLDDGSTVGQVEGGTVNDSGVVVAGDRSDKQLTEDGDLVDYVSGGNSLSSEDHLDGIPLDPNLQASEGVNAELIASDLSQDLAVLQMTGGAAADIINYYAVDRKSGEVAYQFDCPNYTHTDGNNDIAHNSPNGEYGVLESLWITSSEATCFGGGDTQETIAFTAVDDHGTGYAAMDYQDPSEQQLVIIPQGDEPEVSDSPVPIGVMTGDLAIHVDGNSQKASDQRTIYESATITGNHIK